MNHTSDHSEQDQPQKPISPRTFAIAGLLILAFELVLWLGFGKHGPLISGLPLTLGATLLIFAGMEYVAQHHE